MRLQSQLGKESRRMYKEGLNVVKLSLARVIKVNYKYNTVDVITTLSKNTTIKNPNDNGKFSARLPVSFGGRTPDGKIYGSNTLVTVGALVLIGFLEGNKDNPIVLNIYGDSDNQSQLTRTTLTSADESDKAVQQELWQLFNLYPSMTYHNIDGRGNQEITFSGKSFMFITDSDPDNSYVQDEGFDYMDLPSSRYANGELIEPVSPNSPTLLYVHQGVYDNHRVTFFIKSDGTFRIGSKHLDGSGITFQELKTDGSYSITQKKGTTDPEEDTQTLSKIEVDSDGNIVLQTPDHKLEVNKDGVLVDGDQTINGELKVDSIVNPGYTEPTLITGSNHIDTGNGFQRVAYWKDKNGVVRIVGLVTGLINNTIIFKLPSGYRPAKQLPFLCLKTTGTCRIDVKANGDVHAHADVPSEGVSLAGISFKAEQ